MLSNYTRLFESDGPCATLIITDTDKIEKLFLKTLGVPPNPSGIYGNWRDLADAREWHTVDGKEVVDEKATFGKLRKMIGLGRTGSTNNRIYGLRLTHDECTDLVDYDDLADRPFWASRVFHARDIPTQLLFHFDVIVLHYADQYYVVRSRNADTKEHAAYLNREARWNKWEKDDPNKPSPDPRKYVNLTRAEFHIGTGVMMALSAAMASWFTRLFYL